MRHSTPLLVSFDVYDTLVADRGRFRSGSLAVGTCLLTLQNEPAPVVLSVLT